MLWPLLFIIQATCSSVARAMQHYPAAWGHYDVCKSQIYTEEGLAWDYMACQPEATDMTKYLRVTLDPPNITCGDPPETYCALVSCNLVCPVMETNEAVGSITHNTGSGLGSSRYKATATEIDVHTEQLRIRIQALSSSHMLHAHK